jgi:hypothetical protein
MRNSHIKIYEVSVVIEDKHISGSVYFLGIMEPEVHHTLSQANL